ncbi:MAG: mucin-2 protein [Nocardioides sp.]
MARHKRETNARRFVTLAGNRTSRFAVGIATVATVPAVALGVVHAETPLDIAADKPPPLHLDSNRYDNAPVSRGFDRTAEARFQQGIAAQQATAHAVAKAHVKKWASADLNLWSSSEQAARQIGLLQEGKPVLVTGRAADGRVEVVIAGQSRWVTAGYLSDSRPDGVTVSAGLSMAPCPDSSVEYRLTPSAVLLYRSVCHAFPQITSYGGWDAHGEHVTGKALDIMTSDVALGNQIAAWLQAHASQLHIYDILWRQHIWTPVRASEGWRLFADRGSPTANHMDHVHVSVY